MSNYTKYKILNYIEISNPNFTYLELIFIIYFSEIYLTKSAYINCL